MWLNTQNKNTISEYFVSWYQSWITPDGHHFVFDYNLGFFNLYWQLQVPRMVSWQVGRGSKLVSGLSTFCSLTQLRQAFLQWPKFLFGPILVVVWSTNILRLVLLHPPESHVTEASSKWWQLWEPQPGKLQPCNVSSFSPQLTSSMSIKPVPCPKCAFCHEVAAPVKPSCLHTMFASVMSQPSSHTVPHWLKWKTSTLPSEGTLPPTRRILISITWELTSDINNKNK